VDEVRNHCGEKISAQSKLNYQLTLNVHKAKDPGSGDLISQYSHNGGLYRFYNLQKLDAYYSVTKDNFTFYS
jgi:hypothetical protein